MDWNQALERILPVDMLRILQTCCTETELTVFELEERARKDNRVAVGARTSIDDNSVAGEVQQKVETDSERKIVATGGRSRCSSLKLFARNCKHHRSRDVDYLDFGEAGADAHMSLLQVHTKYGGIELAFEKGDDFLASGYRTKFRQRSGD
jgi:hypothetical protein